MIEDLYILTSKDNFDNIRSYLSNVHGLVPPNYKTESHKNTKKIVWEDEGGIGRFRVDFCKDILDLGDCIWFRYWDIIWGTRKKNILFSDPMKEIIRETYDEFNTVITDIFNPNGDSIDLFEVLQ